MVPPQDGSDEAQIEAGLDFGERFVLRELLGKGGNGYVYAAYDRERRMDVALKRLRDPTPQGLYQLKREFRALIGLRHRNLVELYELHQSEHECYFTMELVRGRSFIDWVRPSEDAHSSGADTSTITDATFRETRRSDDSEEATARAGACDPTRLGRALLDLSRGVLALHGAGQVHRDLKPSNVLVDGDGRVVILDFGLATHRVDSVHVTATQAGIVGTPLYMAPEQIGGAVGTPADWYAVGVMLYEAITGRPPFVGAPLQVLFQKQTGEVMDPREMAPDAPEDLCELCLELLRVDPSSRPTGAKILARLEASFPQASSEAPSSASHLSYSTIAPTFVGREVELRALAETFRATAHGETRIVLIEGESGIGKSALMAEFLSGIRTEHPEAIVLRGKCYEWELLPYNAFDGVIDILSRYLGSIDAVDCAHLLPAGISLLARVFPVLSRVRAVQRAHAIAIAPISKDEIRVRAFATLRELLSRCAQRAPLVIAVDDLHWADADSFVLLREVFSGLDAPPCLVVATARPREDRRPWIEPRRVPVQALRLGPLSSDRAKELAEGFWRNLSEAQTGDLGSILDEAAGHPLFVFELVRRAAEADVEERVVRLDDALWSRVASLPPDAKRAMSILCLAGAPLPASVLRDAAGFDAERGARPLALLRASMLARTADRSSVDALEPYHERLREAVVDRLDDDQRSAFHGALADALGSSEAGIRRPDLLVRHLQASGQRARAADAAVRAASAAAEALAFDRAADLYATALSLGELDAAARHELLCRHADALGDAGRGASAAEVWLLAVAGTDAAGRLDCRRKAAAQLLVSGHADRGLAVIREVLDEVGERYPSTALSGIALVLWLRFRLFVRGLRWTRKDPSTISASLRARLEVFGILARSLTMVDPLVGQVFQARELLEALRHGDHLRILASLAMLAGFASATGNFARGRALLALARAHAEADRIDSMLMWIRGVESVVSYVEGDVDRARTEVAELEGTWLANGVRLGQESHLDLIGAAAQLNQLRTIQLASMRMQGLFGELRGLKDVLERDAQRRGDRYLDAILGLGCNVITLLDHGPDMAEGELSLARWSATTGIHSMHWYELRSRAEIDLFRGSSEPHGTHAERLEVMRRSLISRTVIWGADMDYLEARLLLAEVAADHRRAASKLARARRLAERLRRRVPSYARIWGEVIGAAVAARSGDTAAAVDALERLSALATEYHYHLFRSLAAHFLAHYAGGGAPVDALEVFAKEQGVDPDALARIFAPGL